MLLPDGNSVVSVLELRELVTLMISVFIDMYGFLPIASN